VACSPVHLPRPDVAVYRCIDDPAKKPTAQDTVLVVEVASPTTAREDLVDKKAQYATAGIPHYLIVVLDEKYDIAEIREFHLDAASGDYRLHAVHPSILDLEQPVRLTLSIADLVSG
jgi:Uma2 family endonuclease